MKKKEEINIINQIKKLIKMEEKMGNDRRGEEGRGITRRGFLSKGFSGLAKLIGIGAIASAIGCAFLPGKAVEEKDYAKFAKLPSGEIVHFQKPVAEVKDAEGTIHDVYKVTTEDGEKYISFCGCRLVDYCKKTGFVTFYGVGMKKLHTRKFAPRGDKDRIDKYFNSIEEVKEYLKKPRGGPIWADPRVFLAK